jgi:hypothetical protein
MGKHKEVTAPRTLVIAMRMAAHSAGARRPRAWMRICGACRTLPAMARSRDLVCLPLPATACAILEPMPNNAEPTLEPRLAPLLRAVHAALGVDDATDDARRAELQALAREIVGVLTSEMTPNFWRPNRQFAQDALGASIFRCMLRAGFAATPENEERVERILVFTKANWSIFAN